MSPKSYSSVPTDSKEEIVHEAVVAHDAKTIRSNEAYGLTWTDPYYDNSRDEVIAVFDIDHQSFRQSLSCRTGFLSILLSVYVLFFVSLTALSDYDSGLFAFWAVFISIMLYSLRKRFRYMYEHAHGLHVAVTRQGIRKDMHNFPMGSIFHTTTVMPFDEIKSITVQRNKCAQSCCCIKNSANVTVISNSDSTPHMISGLEDPEALVEIVQKMMSGDGTDNMAKKVAV